MKEHINFVKRALALSLVATTLATAPNLTAFAEGNNATTESSANDTTDDTSDDTSSDIAAVERAAREMPDFTVAGDFVPFRDQILRYLAGNSSVKSDIVKKVWCKLFYEELNWKSGYTFYDSKYSSWVNKYGQTEAYRTLDGTYANTSGQITYSTGDFEAYFGNTIEANPEFLGQLLGIASVPGIEGYDVNGLDIKDEAGKELLKNVVGKYLYDESDPTKYNEFFAESIVNLTKDGLYLDGCLKNVTCNGIRADYAVLSNLASKYRQTDSQGNLILSQKQIEWIESYQLEFYNAYTKNANAALKGMVTRNENLYDFIARSKYAADNLNGYGQTFFNYVVASGEGAGEWLALSDKINGASSSLQTKINGKTGLELLKEVSDIAALFDSSSGYCGGLDATTHCSNHSHSCYTGKLTLSNGTPYDTSDDTYVVPAELCKKNATDNDMLCVLLNRNSEAVRYITGNSKTNAAYGTEGTENTWRYRHMAKHKNWGDPDDGPVSPVVPETFTYKVNSGRVDCYDPGAAADYDGCGMKTNTAWFSHTYKISDLLSRTKDQVTTVQLNMWYEGMAEVRAWSSKNNPSNIRDDTCNTAGVLSLNCSPGIILIGKTGSYTYKFDLSNCTASQLKNGWVSISTAASCSSYNGSGRAYASCGINSITYEKVIDDCDIAEHQWQGIPTYTFDEKGYIVGARIDYECDKNKRNHKDSYNVPKTKIGSQITGSSITYKIIGKHGDIYTKVISTGGSSEPYVAKPVAITNDIITGKASASAYSDTEWWPQGWGFKNADGTSHGAHAVAASCEIKGTIKAGYIPTGVNKVIFGFSAGNDLESLSISIYNKRGQKIGYGGTNMAGTISGNTCTVAIYARSDADLLGSTVEFYGKASSIRWASSYYEKLGGISSSISLNSMTFVY